MLIARSLWRAPRLIARRTKYAHRTDWQHRSRLPRLFPGRRVPSTSRSGEFRTAFQGGRRHHGSSAARIRSARLASPCRALARQVFAHDLPLELDAVGSVSRRASTACSLQAPGRHGGRRERGCKAASYSRSRRWLASRPMTKCRCSSTIGRRSQNPAVDRPTRLLFHGIAQPLHVAVPLSGMSPVSTEGQSPSDPAADVAARSGKAGGAAPPQPQPPRAYYRRCSQTSGRTRCFGRRPASTSRI